MDSERPEPDPIARASFAEDRTPDGAPRPGYDATLAALADADLVALCAAIQERLRDRGVGFGGQSFIVDAVPRMLPGPEWDALAAGLQQRARALNAFLHDAYGEQRIVAAGIVEAELISGAEGYEPDLAGRLPGHCAPAAVIGFDIVRDGDGAFLVLEDNLRTPSGIAYAVATREVLGEHIAMPDGLDVHPLDDAFATLGEALRAAAPEEAGDEPFVVLLSDGERNSAFYEHQTIARILELPLVLAEQLSVRGGRLFARLPEGERAVDVVYRRTDEDRLCDEHGEPTHVARLLLEPVLAGTLACVNAFGTGVADDKLLHAYVEEIVRYYLAEEPLIGSVPTYDPGRPEMLEMILDRIDELVIKPRSGHGGYGVVIAPHARAADVRKAAKELTAAPERFVVQETVMLSRHPTVTDGRLEPRHVDLRPFAISSGEQVHVLPGGLTRVAFDADALVVNSSQNGGSKDTWVLR